MPLKNSYDPGEYNKATWEGAANARRLIQQRRAAGQRINAPTAAPEEYLEAGKKLAKLAQEVRHAEQGADIRRALPEEFDDGSIEERLARLGETHIAQQMRRRLVGSQAPEPVIEVVGPKGPEGGAVTHRLWAVDDEEFGKKAGEVMTDAEYAAVCRRMKPVQWDENGVPTEYAPAHAPIDPTEGTAQRVPTRREREEAKQYAVRGFAPATEETPATDHTILPEPYVEPVDPDLP